MSENYNDDNIHVGYEESYKKRDSFISMESNPFDKSYGGGDSSKVENLTDCKPIKPEEFALLLMKLLDAEDYDEDFITIIEEDKVPFLFSSRDLMKLMELSESMTVKMSLISNIAPRLTDPSGQYMEDFINIFDSQQDRKKVEEIFDSRIKTLNSSSVNKVDHHSVLFSTSIKRLSGRGGRGGIFRSYSSNNNSPNRVESPNPLNLSISLNISDNTSSPTSPFSPSPPQFPETPSEDTVNNIIISNSSEKEKKGAVIIDPLQKVYHSSARRGSVIQMVINPFSKSGKEALKSKSEDLTDCTPINPEEFVLLLLKLLEVSENEEEEEDFISILEEQKMPYLFSSTDLIKLLELSTSTKIKMSIISGIVPRLTDPIECSNDIVHLFENREEQQLVEDIFINKIQSLSSSSAKKMEHHSALFSKSVNRLSGKAGRGFSRSNSSPINSNS